MDVYSPNHPDPLGLNGLAMANPVIHSSVEGFETSAGPMDVGECTIETEHSHGLTGQNKTINGLSRGVLYFLYI